MSIQKMRLQRGWSQQQLADASGLSARTVQRIESGHAGSVESIKSLAAVFEVDFSTLVSEEAMTEQTPSTQSSQERIAFRKARRVRDYYLHLLIYLAANAGCIAINLFTNPQTLWFVGLSLFWGIGLLAHTLRIFVFDRYFDGQWERAYVEKLLKRPL
ncbi:helix-turn-helix domain-containing protein [Telluria aromaticivorans]|uniref:Helix-turn-helix domain-containing protein n=1 Tax=Telluria aromaticivorans TaxID=2725995 RepID=A0A7Y2JV26_9BURK|nr:helix-turn-helix domain-containing protein [Telluria aromaticivorans]NNG21526.1 helix-turn-helix domain-containing protein [Telluria aromaticivorans]